MAALVYELIETKYIIKRSGFAVTYKSYIDIACFEVNKKEIYN